MPANGFETTFRNPKDAQDDQAGWFVVHKEVGIRLHVHSHRNEGLVLEQHDLVELKKIVDYLVDSDAPTLEGMRRALHPEDFSTEDAPRAVVDDVI